MTKTPPVPDLADVPSMEEFVASSEGLRTVLKLIDTIGPEAWQTLPAARVLLDVAQRRFAPLARAWHRPVEDATHAAWMAMRGRSVRDATDPWAVITRAVELAMQAETIGERQLISPEKARRRIHRSAETPMRAGEHEELLFDVIAGAGEADDTERVDDLIRVVAAFLVMTGWDDTKARWATEYVAARTADLGSPQSALDVLRRDHAVRLRLGLQQQAWSRLLALLIGSDPHDVEDGEPGLFARVLTGEDLSDLLLDAALLEQAGDLLSGSDR